MKSKIIAAIPVYNGEAFIVQTLQSLANQTLRPDRVIVLDNRSTDDTGQLVKEFKPLRVEWRQNEANLGCFSESRIQLTANETPVAEQCCGSGGATAGEGVENRVAGIAGALNDRGKQSQRELSWKIRNAFLAVLDEARNGPDVVPEFAVWGRSFVCVLELAVGRPTDAVRVEDEAAGILHAVENVP